MFFRYLELYFLSDAGRNVTQNLIVVGAVLLPIANMCKHNFSERFIKRLHQLEDNKKSVDLPDWLRALTIQEYSKSGCPKTPNGSLRARFIISDTEEPVLLGAATGVHNIARIGLPLFLTFTCPDDVRNNHSLIKLTSLPLGVPFSVANDKEFMSTMLLSERAKRFIIQQHLQRTLSSARCTLIPGLQVLAGLLPAAACYFINRRLSLLHRQFRFIRYSMYLTLFPASARGHAVMRDKLLLSEQTKADTITSRYGDDYVLGGIEYYQKLLERNKLTSRLIESTEARKIFTKSGDYVPRLFRINRVPIEARLNNMRSLLHKDHSGDKVQFGSERMYWGWRNIRSGLRSRLGLQPDVNENFDTSEIED